MVTTVKTQPNHYELLGLTPGATDADIDRAVAAQISPLRPRPIGELALIVLAYETLRNSTKRRAYDESIQPKPQPAPSRSSVICRDGWPIVRPSQVAPTGNSAALSLAADERQPNPLPRPEVPAAPDLPPFLASSLGGEAQRSGRSAASAVRPSASPALRAGETASPARSADRAEHSLNHPTFEGLLHTAEDGTFALKPAVAAGVMLMGCGMLGAWLGSGAGNAGQQPGQTVTVAVAEAKPPAPDPRDAALPVAAEKPQAAIRPSTASAPALAEAREVRKAGTVAGAPEPAVAQQPFDRTLPDVEERQAVGPEPSRTEDIATDPAVAGSAPATAVPAKLPLPNSVVARTIKRIGYACGSVASVAPVETSPAGVFKVTCTSGNSYRAAPVGGRYHFRKW